jgi:hypothetical protein
MKPKPCLEAELKSFGCPYAATDPRTPAWLGGYRAGYKAATDNAVDAMRVRA